MIRHIIAGGVTVVAVLLAPHRVHSQQHAAPPTLESSRAADTAHIAHLERAWADGLITRDSALLDGILAPDFTLIVSASPDRPFSRAVWFAQLREYRTDSLAIRDLHVREAGTDVLVASFVARLKATVRGEDRSGDFFITDVWRRQPNGRWQAAARYSSRPEGATASSRVLREQADSQERR